MKQGTIGPGHAAKLIRINSPGRVQGRHGRLEAGAASECRIRSRRATERRCVQQPAKVLAGQGALLSLNTAATEGRAAAVMDEVKGGGAESTRLLKSRWNQVVLEA